MFITYLFSKVITSEISISSLATTIITIITIAKTSIAIIVIIIDLSNSM